MQLAHENRPAIRRDRLLRLPEVEAVTGCKKSTIYLLIQRGEFPKGVAVTGRMRAWPESSVLQWVQDRITLGAATGAADQQDGGR